MATTLPECDSGIFGRPLRDGGEVVVVAVLDHTLLYGSVKTEKRTE